MNQPTDNQKLSPMSYRECFGAREILRAPPGWELGVYPKGAGFARERPAKAVRFRPNQRSCFL